MRDAAINIIEQERNTMKPNMKTAFRCLASFTAIVTLFLATGCNTVSINSNQYLGVQTYPPSDPAQIQILRKEPDPAPRAIGRSPGRTLQRQCQRAKDRAVHAQRGGQDGRRRHCHCV